MLRSGKKWVRRTKRAVLGLALVVLILGFSVFGTVDYTHYSRQAYFKTTLERVEKLNYPKEENGEYLLAGWSKVNITPEQPCDMAAYGNRGPYEGILDSVYLRTIVLDNGISKIGIVSYDLLMVSKAIEDGVNQLVDSIGLGLDGIYFCATHTHSSIGNWSKPYGYSFTMGDFRQDITDMIINKTITSFKQSIATADTSTVCSYSKRAPKFVYNRLVNGGITDDLFRMVFLSKSNGQKAAFSTYSAHPTILKDDNKLLSNDYVGYMLNRMEKNMGLDMAMFAAGTVGSHGPFTWIEGGGDVRKFGEQLADSITVQPDSLRFKKLTSLAFYELPVMLGEPQLRTRDFFGFRLRSWVFNSLLDEPEISLKFLKFDRLFFASTPCDFSGEFSQKISASTKIGNESIVVTSFGGGYTGYAIPSKYYEIDHTETHEMNWYGPFHGDYLSALIGTGFSKIK